MILDLDPDGLRVAMDLWRNATDMSIPLSADLRSHFFAGRGKLLQGFVKVASDWLMLLQSCTATGDDLVELDGIRREILAFKAWADSGLSEIARLAKE